MQSKGKSFQYNYLRKLMHLFKNIVVFVTAKMHVNEIKYEQLAPSAENGNRMKSLHL